MRTLAVPAYRHVYHNGRRGGEGGGEGGGGDGDPTYTSIVCLGKMDSHRSFVREEMAACRQVLMDAALHLV